MRRSPSCRVWRDLNQNGVAEEGELQTLAQAGIKSISLVRTDGTTGSAQTIYFQTDRQDT